MEILAHVIILSFTLFVISCANPGSSLFSYHPTCMVLAWGLWTEGVLLFRRPSVGWRVPVHWALQASALTLALGGFYAIYTNKQNSKKEHFSTWHALIGLFTLGLLTIQSVGGNFAKFSFQISKRFKFVKPSLIKWGHRSSALISLSAASLTIFLSLFSFWFVASVSNSFIWWTIAIALPYPLVYTLKTTYF